jgi:hypothetical protein
VIDLFGIVMGWCKVSMLTGDHLFGLFCMVLFRYVMRMLELYLRVRTAFSKYKYKYNFNLYIQLL